MPLWEYPIHQMTSRLDCRQWEFLTTPKREVHLAILVELYKARQQETLHELPFDLLHERLVPRMEELGAVEELEAAGLRALLNRLQTWGNVATRLEPRRVRTISDRGLKLLLVRLSESTNTILEHLESQLEKIEHESASSARFSLLEVDDALEAVISLREREGGAVDEDYCRAARELFRARGAVEDAGDELLRLDLWLSETAVQPPDRERLADLLGHLETYFDRYLEQVDERRERCYQKLGALGQETVEPFLIAVEQALAREFANDPTRASRRAPEIRPLLGVIQEFLKPDGILDHRRTIVHQRLADVVGHLKRFLAELVRRSQLTAALRKLSGDLLHAPDECFPGVAAEFFLRLWQPAHTVLDESTGVPVEKVVPPRPYVYRPAKRRRFAGATVRPSQNGRPKSSRPMLIKQMEDLNEFVFRVVLSGNREALVDDAALENFEQVRLLISAIRMARDENSRLRRQYLRYRVVYPTVEKRVALTLSDGTGRLHLPQLIFTGK